MTPERIRIVIAESVGIPDQWVIVKRGLYYRPNAKGYTNCISQAWKVSEKVADEHVYPHDEPVTKRRVVDIPDYPNDRNSILSVTEKLQGNEQFEFILHLWEVMGLQKRYGFLHSVIRLELPLVMYLMLHATALQLCEAYLRTINRWEKE